MNTNPSQSTPALQSPSLEMLMGGFDDIEVQQSHWERLPVEIMADIFLMCLPSRKNWSPCKTHAPYLLTGVCRFWYKVVVESSKMWSTVVLTTDDDSDTIPPSRLEAGARHAEMCFARSKRAPVELYVRAEFIGYPASFEHIRQANLQQLILKYPTDGVGRLAPFLPLSSWALPNMTALEVHTERKVSREDEVFLSDLLVQPLRKFICASFGDTKIIRGRYFPNMSNLEVLVLKEDILISSCLFILQNAPSLRQLSLVLEMYFPNEPVLRGMEPFHLSVQPFVHPNLQYLALTPFESEISTLFDRVTLPSLHFLALDFEEDISEAVWPHDNIIAFLQRSHCKLRSFHVVGQLVTPSQLLELLRLPQLADSLKYLGIQSHYELNKTIDDTVLEALTLPPSSLQEANPILGHDFIPNAPVLCPNMERLVLHFALKGITISKLIAMFDSHLPWNASSAFPHKFIRQIDIMEKWMRNLDASTRKD